MVVVVFCCCDGGGGVDEFDGCAEVLVVDVCMKSLQVPHEALEIAGMLINFRFGKFGYSICPIFSKGHAEIFREFWHDFC